MVLPILLLVVCGGFDFGRAFSTMSDAQKGLRAATRFLTTLPAAAVCDGTFLRQAQNLAVYGNVGGTGRATIEGWKPQDVVKVTPTACTAADLGIIKLSSRVTYNALIWRVVGLPASISFTVEHEERWLGE